MISKLLPTQPLISRCAVNDRNGWQKMTRNDHKGNSTNYNQQSAIEFNNSRAFKLPLDNCYCGMQIDDDVFQASDNYNDEIHSQIKNIHDKSSVKKRPNIVINKHQENDVILTRNTVVERTNPGNSTYAHITSQGEKTCIVGDSICRPIDG